MLTEIDALLATADDRKQRVRSLNKYQIVSAKIDSKSVTES